MKLSLLPLLFLLLWSLVVVHSQTVPYVSFMGVNLPNHSYVDLTAVGRPNDGGEAVQCHTDLSTCCSGAEGSHRGDWYFHNGSRLLFPGSDNSIYENRFAQRVDLYRRNNANSPSGIYRCEIPTIAVHGDNDISVRETVYVVLNATGGITNEW